jgi:hypothetical protein
MPFFLITTPADLHCRHSRTPMPRYCRERPAPCARDATPRCCRAQRRDAAADFRFSPPDYAAATPPIDIIHVFILISPWQLPFTARLSPPLPPLPPPRATHRDAARRDAAPMARACAKERLPRRFRAPYAMQSAA